MVQVASIENHSVEMCQLIKLCIDGLPSRAVTARHRIVTRIDGWRTETVFAEQFGVMPDSQTSTLFF